MVVYSLISIPGLVNQSELLALLLHISQSEAVEQTARDSLYNTRSQALESILCI